eukprot:gnl/MRDRNA2_/MRDRNA2_74470_c0_seq1.p1 gnl/MRDRNA2_/MRDRNA2_74470_c0~~gnl/MRDRNA2_/MRDRNA2_74470_c0_seq1.p1  ORF type:complete len:220 (-),score=21.33 gnl/MRDRNA2_/MRDRNA2_74470_c0_seq1:21-680(-)
MKGRVILTMLATFVKHITGRGLAHSHHEHRVAEAFDAAEICPALNPKVETQLEIAVSDCASACCSSEGTVCCMWSNSGCVAAIQSPCYFEKQWKPGKSSRKWVRATKRFGILVGTILATAWLMSEQGQDFLERIFSKIAVSLRSLGATTDVAGRTSSRPSNQWGSSGPPVLLRARSSYNVSSMSTAALLSFFAGCGVTFAVLRFASSPPPVDHGARSHS